MSKVVTVQRFIPQGMVHPKTGFPYLNMEASIRAAMAKYPEGIPVLQNATTLGTDEGFERAVKGPLKDAGVEYIEPMEEDGSVCGTVLKVNPTTVQILLHDGYEGVAVGRSLAFRGSFSYKQPEVGVHVSEVTSCSLMKVHINKMYTIAEPFDECMVVNVDISERTHKALESLAGLQEWVPVYSKTLLHKALEKSSDPYTGLAQSVFGAVVACDCNFAKILLTPAGQEVFDKEKDGTFHHIYLNTINHAALDGVEHIRELFLYGP